MSIQLNYNEDFSEGLKRLMIDECRTAINYLSKASSVEEKHEAVHEARKAFKKIRASLRLVRDHIDYYQEENTWFRDRGREVSEVRDATAHFELLEVLKEQYGSELYENTFNDLHKELQQHREKLAEITFHEKDRLPELQQAVEEKVKKIPGWPIEIQNFDEIRPSIKRVYKRGYKALQKSLESGEVKDFHEWRKRAKYLRYQIDILNRLWPQVFTVYEDELHDITDFTGTVNDIQNLQITVQNLDEPFSSRDEKMLFDAITRKHEKSMKKHALLKGRKFYVDSPSDFCDRMEVYWNTHQEEMGHEDLPRAVQLEST